MKLARAFITHVTVRFSLYNLIACTCMSKTLVRNPCALLNTLHFDLCLDIQTLCHLQSLQAPVLRGPLYDIPSHLAVALNPPNTLLSRESLSTFLLWRVTWIMYNVFEHKLCMHKSLLILCKSLLVKAIEIPCHATVLMDTDVRNLAWAMLVGLLGTEGSPTAAAKEKASIAFRKHLGATFSIDEAESGSIYTPAMTVATYSLQLHSRPNRLNLLPVSVTFNRPCKISRGSIMVTM